MTNLTAPGKAEAPTPGKAPGIGGLRRSGIAARVRAVTPSSVVNAARGTARAYGVRTASMRPLPDYLVIGAKKGGTTSVANWLVRHPQVMPMFPRLQSAKSPHYFDINYWRGEQWYRSHFPSSAARRAHERRTGRPSLVGESSPYYLFHPAAPSRIRETVPRAKLIAVLREPVSRAHSNFWDRTAVGAETLPTFEQAIEAEEERLRGVTDEYLMDPRAYSFDHDNHTYLARGYYAQQLRRYFSVFDREQLLVLTMDELHTDARGTFERIEAFLGLAPADIELTEYNVRKSNPKIDPNTKERLRAHYAPHNRELEELLGRELGW